MLLLRRPSIKQILSQSSSVIYHSLTRNTNAMATLPPLKSFTAVHNHLTTSYPAPLLPPSKPHSQSLTSQIAALELHPTLEAALHILNNDLPSAHFLVRHMQSAPAFEGMFLHGILHRVEGDYDNARMWYSDVKKEGDGKELYAQIWGSEGKGFKELGEELQKVTFVERKEWGQGGSRETELDKGQQFLNAVQGFKIGKKNEEKQEKLESESKREIDTVVEWCVEKFGSERWVDASEAWVKNSEEIQKMSDDQVNGDSGRRKF